MNMEEIYQSIEHIAKCEMYDAIEVKYLKSKFEELQQENKQLKDNWNMLKEHLKNRYDNGTESISYRQVFMEIREAMQVLEIAQELEKGDSNENRRL